MKKQLRAAKAKERELILQCDELMKQAKLNKVNKMAIEIRDLKAQLKMAQKTAEYREQQQMSGSAEPMMVTPDNTASKKIKFSGKDESLALKRQIAEFTEMAKRQKKQYEESQSQVAELEKEIAKAKEM